MFFIGAGVLVACIVAWLMARVIVRPVEQAAETARSIGQGFLSARFDPVPAVPLELAELSNTLIQIATRIETKWRNAFVAGAIRRHRPFQRSRLRIRQNAISWTL